ncbi:unnamed protein product [Mycena citricolor]|uniref:Uncharacterized protein n=1 Tax=Mycena citricolor TaxID=2018698 RepID=A0AAD2H2X6_9AGAR|nr:unnamed protein product [Mycena citricolor]
MLGRDTTPLRPNIRVPASNTIQATRKSALPVRKPDVKVKDRGGPSANAGTVNAELTMSTPEADTRLRSGRLPSSASPATASGPSVTRTSAKAAVETGITETGIPATLPVEPSRSIPILRSAASPLSKISSSTTKLASPPTRLRLPSTTTRSAILFPTSAPSEVPAPLSPPTSLAPPTPATKPSTGPSRLRAPSTKAPGVALPKSISSTAARRDATTKPAQTVSNSSSVSPQTPLALHSISKLKSPTTLVIKGAADPTGTAMLRGRTISAAASSTPRKSAATTSIPRARTLSMMGAGSSRKQPSPVPPVPTSPGPRMRLGTVASGSTAVVPPAVRARATATLGARPGKLSTSSPTSTKTSVTGVATSSVTSSTAVKTDLPTATATMPASASRLRKPSSTGKLAASRAGIGGNGSVSSAVSGPSVTTSAEGSLILTTSGPDASTAALIQRTSGPSLTSPTQHIPDTSSATTAISPEKIQPAIPRSKSAAVMSSSSARKRAPPSIVTDTSSLPSRVQVISPSLPLRRTSPRPPPSPSSPAHAAAFATARSVFQRGHDNSVTSTALVASGTGYRSKSLSPSPTPTRLYLGKTIADISREPAASYASPTDTPPLSTTSDWTPSTPQGDARMLATPQLHPPVAFRVPSLKEDPNCASFTEAHVDESDTVTNLPSASTRGNIRNSPITTEATRTSVASTISASLSAVGGPGPRSSQESGSLVSPDESTASPHSPKWSSNASDADWDSPSVYRKGPMDTPRQSEESVRGQYGPEVAESIVGQILPGSAATQPVVTTASTLEGHLKQSLRREIDGTRTMDLEQPVRMKTIALPSPIPQDPSIELPTIRRRTAGSWTGTNPGKDSVTSLTGISFARSRSGKGEGIDEALLPATKPTTKSSASSHMHPNYQSRADTASMALGTGLDTALPSGLPRSPTTKREPQFPVKQDFIPVDRQPKKTSAFARLPSPLLIPPSSPRLSLVPSPSTLSPTVLAQPLPPSPLPSMPPSAMRLPPPSPSRPVLDVKALLANPRDRSITAEGPRSRKTTTLDSGSFGTGADDAIVTSRTTIEHLERDGGYGVKTAAELSSPRILEGPSLTSKLVPTTNRLGDERKPRPPILNLKLPLTPVSITMEPPTPLSHGTSGAGTVTQADQRASAASPSRIPSLSSSPSRSHHAGDAPATPQPYYTVFGSTSGRTVSAGSGEDWISSSFVHRTQSTTSERSLVKRFSERFVRRKESADDEQRGRTSSSSMKLSKRSLSRSSRTSAWSLGAGFDDDIELPPPKELRSRKPEPQSGNRVWRLMKRISTGGMKEKYEADDHAFPPPVPPLPSALYSHRGPLPLSTRSLPIPTSSNTMRSPSLESKSIPNRSRQSSVSSDYPERVSDDPSIIRVPTMNAINSSRFEAVTFRAQKNEKTGITEQEKADRWNELLERSDRAGGTLRFGVLDNSSSGDLFSL